LEQYASTVVMQAEAQFDAQLIQQATDVHVGSIALSCRVEGGYARPDLPLMVRGAADEREWFRAQSVRPLVSGHDSVSARSSHRATRGPQG
jgi:hypothetical protein